MEFTCNTWTKYNTGEEQKQGILVWNMWERYKTHGKCRLGSESSRRDVMQQSTENWNNTDRNQRKNS